MLRHMYARQARVLRAPQRVSRSPAPAGDRSAAPADGAAHCVCARVGGGMGWGMSVSARLGPLEELAALSAVVRLRHLEDRQVLRVQSKAECRSADRSIGVSRRQAVCADSSLDPRRTGSRLCRYSAKLKRNLEPTLAERSCARGASTRCEYALRVCHALSTAARLIRKRRS